MRSQDRPTISNAPDMRVMVPFALNRCIRPDDAITERHRMVSVDMKRAWLKPNATGKGDRKSSRGKQ